MNLMPLDLTDDEAMRATYDLTRRSALHGRESMPHWTFTEFLGAMRSPDSGERQEVFVAVQDEAIVGSYIAWYFLLDNLEKVWFDLHVDPQARRQGHGTALLRHVEERAAADGRTLMATDTRLSFGETETHGYRAFARRHGYDLANVEVVRHLSLPVEEARIQGWIEQATPDDSEYRFETLVDEVPDAYAESLCVLLGQLAVDAPTGAVDYEEETMTPERLRESRATARAMDRTLLESIAVAPDGTVVAQSTLSVPKESKDPVFQWGTFVHREHRGHRLGLAVKARNLRVLQETAPGHRVITTQNAETNDYMVAINEQIGFKTVEDSVELFKRLGT